MSESVMLMLREGTGADHKAAESQPFQRALVKGDLPMAAYIAYLQQMLLVHAALEERLAGCGEPPVRRVVSGEQFQGANLRADLAAVNGHVQPEALPATARLVERLGAEAGAAGLLGHLYVLEGSNNGATYIARAVRRALAIQPGQGDRYLDPHGESQKPVWEAFKARMDAEAWTPADREQMLDAARVMFQAIGEISAELEEMRLRLPPVSVVQRPAGAEVRG